MTPEQIVHNLALHIRNAVRPHLGSMLSRKLMGVAVSGDTTFAIDEIAEDAIVSFIEERGLSIAYYSEDRGLIEFGQHPEGVLVIDPIDGTRPAMAGFEQCVVSVAYADYKPGVTLGDVRFGCIAELKQDDVFLAERGKGVKWLRGDGSLQAPRLLPITRIDRAPLTFEIAARPLRYIAAAAGEIVDACSLNAGCFSISSTAFSLTRLVSGQLAAVIDIGPRIIVDVPAARPAFHALGGGKMIGLFTYDVAAAALIAIEAGAIVTDAYGHPLDSTPLLDTSQENLRSMCAATTPELHAALLRSLDDGIAHLSGTI
ncbi:MAG: inositol monophosphatase family protein [Capsulimonadaceae bacterium]|nr:inositol monophosphatase family protein [Capsulimonadaceae bacterium]